MPRLFVAAALPPPLLDALRDLQADRDGFRWVPPGRMHLTLRFIGDVEETQAQRLEEALRALTAPAFELHPERLGVFPSRRKPRVLWVGLQPEPLLADLHAAIDRILVRKDVAPDPRPFSPHITLARLRRVDPREVRAFINAHRDLDLPSFAVRHAHLYESELHPDGARHRRRASYPLG